MAAATRGAAVLTVVDEPGGSSGGKETMVARAALALACLSAAVPTHAGGFSLGLEATLGGQHLGVDQAPGIEEPLAPMGDAGATLLLRSGNLALGLAAEGNFDGTTLERFNGSVLAGFAVDAFPAVRLELLGELGAANLRAVDDLQNEPGAGSWERFYGVRPGLSLGIPVLPFRIGVWGLARWGLPGSGEGADLGVLGRIGFEL
jgi:hypothetical protein